MAVRGSDASFDCLQSVLCCDFGLAHTSVTTRARALSKKAARTSRQDARWARGPEPSRHSSHSRDTSVYSHSLRVCVTCLVVVRRCSVARRAAHGWRADSRVRCIRAAIA